MLRREILAIAALSVLPSVASAQDSVKIGLILPMTGQQASTGKQIDAAVKLYQAQKGTTVAGKKIEVIVSQDPADHRPGDRARARPHRARGVQRAAARRRCAARAPSRSHQGVTRISKRS